MCISYFRVCRIDVIDIPVEMTVNSAASIHGEIAMGVGCHSHARPLLMLSRRDPDGRMVQRLETKGKFI